MSKDIKSKHTWQTRENDAIGDWISSCYLYIFINGETDEDTLTQWLKGKQIMCQK